MSLEDKIDALTIAVDKLNDTLRTYPTAVDEIEQDKMKKAESPVETENETKKDETSTASEFTIADLAKLAKAIIQADSSKEKMKKIKAKMNEFGVAKINEVPKDNIDELYTYLESIK